MVNKKFFCFFSFLLILIPLFSACSFTLPCPGGGTWCLCEYAPVNGSVVITDVFSDIDIYYGKDEQMVYYYMNDFFSGYNSVRINVMRDNGDNNSLTRLFGADPACLSKVATIDGEYCLSPVLTSTVVDNIYLRIASTGRDANNTVTVYAINYTDNSYMNQTFVIHFYSTSSYLSGEGNGTGPRADGFVGSMANVIYSLFPSAETLSLRARFSYILIVVFFSILTLYVLLYLCTFNHSIPSIAHYLALIITVLWLFYFVAITYIPVGILVVFVLLLLVMGYFKIRKGV